MKKILPIFFYSLAYLLLALPYSAEANDSFITCNVTSYDNGYNTGSVELR